METRDPLTKRLKHAWNAFLNRDESLASGNFDFGSSYASRPGRIRFATSNDQSIVSTINTHISIDACGIDMKHVRLDANDRYVEDIRTSGLYYCLTQEANIDQAGRAFRQDVVLTMLSEGVVAIVPVDTSVNPAVSSTPEILTMRVGKVTRWFPRSVEIDLYNDLTGRHERIRLPKNAVAIVENPFYQVMNEPNSTMQRLIRKLHLLDMADEDANSSKLDLIIQLPYVIKSDARRKQAEQRRSDIEFQLKQSKYGIAYTDGTEKVIQLNRSAENNLLKQIEYLTNKLFEQLGLSSAVLDGTASEPVMLNYMNRTIEPILGAISEEMKRKFLSRTARTQGHSIEYFRDPFKLVPMSQLAELADKLTRNEILSSNEIRGFIGLKPSNDPKADQLQNSNMPDNGSVNSVPPSE